MQKNGYSLRSISKLLCRSHTTLSREVKRNRTVRLGYLPDSAGILAAKRKASPVAKLLRHPSLREGIIRYMRDERYSPEMIAGVLKQRGAKVRVSTETIYRFIYSKFGVKHQLYKHLMRHRPRRQKHCSRKDRGNYGIPERVSISQRPEINSEEFGHFEADLTFFKNSKANLLTVVERKTGFLVATLNRSKHSNDVACKLVASLVKFPKHLRKSLTMDNGKEFVLHHKVRDVLDIPTYFCNPASPWQKPYVEATHALLHRFLPKNTNISNLSQQQVQHAIDKLNNLPRKRFNFKSPAQIVNHTFNFIKAGALRT